MKKNLLKGLSNLSPKVLAGLCAALSFSSCESDYKKMGYMSPYEQSVYQSFDIAPDDISKSSKKDAVWPLLGIALGAGVAFFVATKKSNGK